MLSFKYKKNKFSIIDTPPLSMMCFKFKNDITWVLNGDFLFNSRLFCFILLSNFVKKVPCQTLRRRANLEKSVLIRRTMYQFCIFDSCDTYSGYRYVEQRWYVVSSSFPDCHSWSYSHFTSIPLFIKKPDASPFTDNFGASHVYQGLFLNQCSTIKLTNSEK